MAEKKFIDADWLTSKIFPFGMVADGNYPINAKSIKMAIDNALSADVVEVVRCKDCKHYSLISDYCTHDLAMNLCRGGDFCSYGERKEQT